MEKKKSFARAGERAQQLRALVDFCGEPTLSFSTHTVDHNHLSLQFQEIPPLSMFKGTYRMHIHTCKQNTHRKSFLKVHENQEKGNQNTTLNYSHLGAMAVFLFRNFILISLVAGSMSCKQRIKNDCLVRKVKILTSSFFLSCYRAILKSGLPSALLSPASCKTAEFLIGTSGIISHKTKIIPTSLEVLWAVKHLAHKAFDTVHTTLSIPSGSFPRLHKTETFLLSP